MQGLRLTVIVSFILVATAQNVGAQVPCSISGLTQCYFISKPDDIEIVDWVFSGLDEAVEYVAAEYDSDTELTVNEVSHLGGDNYPVSVRRLRSAGRHSVLGWAKLYGNSRWGSVCYDLILLPNGNYSDAVNCPDNTTIYSARLTLHDKNMALASNRLGVSLEEVERHVAMHEFFHAIGFLGHPNTCNNRVSDNCASMPLVLTSFEIALIDAIY